MKSRRKQRAALRKPVRCVHGAGRAPRGRAGCRARSTTVGQSDRLCGRTCSALGCTLGFVRLACGEPVHFCHRAPFFGLSVRTRRDTHACMQCSAVRGCHEVEERESVASVQFRLCSVLATAARIVCSGVGACRTRVHFRAMSCFWFFFACQDS